MKCRIFGFFLDSVVGFEELMNEVDVEEGLGSSDSIGWIALSTFFGEVAELPVDDGVVSLAIEVK